MILSPANEDSYSECVLLLLAHYLPPIVVAEPRIISTPARSAVLAPDAICTLLSPVLPRLFPTFLFCFPSVNTTEQGRRLFSELGVHRGGRVFSTHSRGREREDGMDAVSSLFPPTPRGL